jgi:hypothetical protein
VDKGRAIPRGGVPTGHITAFDKGQYDKLTGFLLGAETDLNHDVMVPAASDVDFRAVAIRPGAAGWDPAARLAASVKTFGSSLFDRLTEVDGELTRFGDALAGARKVFEDTDDLSRYSASAFTDKYPAVANGPTTGGSGTGSGTGSGPTS